MNKGGRAGRREEGREKERNKESKGREKGKKLGAGWGSKPTFPTMLGERGSKGKRERVNRGGRRREGEFKVTQEKKRCMKETILD